jgi:anti-sigma B factor antagonist
MAFSISTTDAGATRLTIDGELNALTMPVLRPHFDSVVAQQPPRVEIDLSHLRMVDSTGIAGLISIYKRIRATGGSTVITGLRDQPLAIFKLLRLERVMGDAP